MYPKFSCFIGSGGNYTAAVIAQPSDNDRLAPVFGAIKLLYRSIKRVKIGMNKTIHGIFTLEFFYFIMANQSSMAASRLLIKIQSKGRIYLSNIFWRGYEKSSAKFCRFGSVLFMRWK
jgi:hypothetical protein